MALSIFCPHCQRHTAVSTAPAEYEESYGSKYHTAALWDTGHGDKWWIGICNYCHKPVLVKNNGQEIYPKPFPSPTDSRIPNPMRQDILEAKLCYSIDAFRGCSVMARRAMQNACINKGATKKDLVHQIEELQTNGIITKDIKEWADVVRWVGNDAAHPNKDDVVKEDAEDILSLAEQFLQVLYVAPAIAQARRTIRKK
ncbi:MAG TPA: DUF4145 domain-containing protein [Cyclobacteriaceae bacterium]|nr:DUF4145 domain-containing protein [Cyclobacteriaceae bacterium]